MIVDRFPDLFIDDGANMIEYCDACELCIRNSMIPCRGIGVIGSKSICHIVSAPSPADNKSKVILSGNTGKFIRRILKDKGLLNISYITSIVKCGIFSQVNAKAIKTCFPKFKTELERVNPSIIITYGKDPYFIITGKPFPKDKEGIEILPNGKILIYTITLEQMRVINDFSYLDRAYDVATQAYRKFVNKWQMFK